MPRATDITITVFEDGTLDVDTRRFLTAQLTMYAGSDVRIQISKPKRTTRANNYYWGVVIDLIHRASFEAGMPTTGATLHAEFKKLYLSPRPSTVFGREVVLGPTTTELDKTAFHEYIESIKYDEEVVRLGVFIPKPETYRSYKLAEPCYNSR